MEHRRCVRDCERHPDHHETCLYWSVIHIMAVRGPPPVPATVGPGPGTAPGRTSVDPAASRITDGTAYKVS